MSEKAGMWAGEFVKPWDWRRGKRLRSQIKVISSDVKPLVRIPTLAGCLLCYLFALLWAQFSSAGLPAFQTSKTSQCNRCRIFFPRFHQVFPLPR